MTFSRDRKYYVDAWQRVDMAPIAQLRQTDREHHVLRHAQRRRHPPGGRQLEAVPLAVVDRQGEQLETVRPGDGPGGRRVQPPG